jgi:hypothetical protein
MMSRIGCRGFGAVVFLVPVAVLSADDGITLENVVSPGANRADEPFADEFFMREAVRFLDSAALTWQKQRQCFSCHSNYAFLMARPAVTHEALAHRQIREAAEFLATHPRKTGYAPTEAVMVASVLAQNDASTTGKLHPATRFALDRIWELQREDGGWKWLDDNEPPSEIEEHYGVTMAAIGVGIAPDNYSQTPAAKKGLKKIRKFRRDCSGSRPTNEPAGVGSHDRWTRTAGNTSPTREQPTPSSRWPHVVKKLQPHRPDPTRGRSWSPRNAHVDGLM